MSDEILLYCLMGLVLPTIINPLTWYNLIKLYQSHKELKATRKERMVLEKKMKNL